MEHQARVVMAVSVRAVGPPTTQFGPPVCTCASSRLMVRGTLTTEADSPGAESEMNNLNMRTM